ncbi:MAG TPA: hypothetical protein GXX75_12395 [Clostridiales bacterium]|nr:hypothetical protein [Clostridiales bacterium]
MNILRKPSEKNETEFMKNSRTQMKKSRPVLYILAGAYLLYIDYTLVKDWANLDNKVLFVIFMVAFALIGGTLVVYSAWQMLKDRNSPNDPVDVAQDEEEPAGQEGDSQEEADNQDRMDDGTDLGEDSEAEEQDPLK